MPLVEFETVCAAPKTPCPAARPLKHPMFSLTTLFMAENMAITFCNRSVDSLFGRSTPDEKLKSCQHLPPVSYSDIEVQGLLEPLGICLTNER
jgi:hypothetical protein